MMANIAQEISMLKGKSDVFNRGRVRSLKRKLLELNTAPRKTVLLVQYNLTGGYMVVFSCPWPEEMPYGSIASIAIDASRLGRELIEQIIVTQEDDYSDLPGSIVYVPRTHHLYADDAAFCGMPVDQNPMRVRKRFAEEMIGAIARHNPERVYINGIETRELPPISERWCDVA